MSTKMRAASPASALWWLRKARCGRPSCPPSESYERCCRMSLTYVLNTPASGREDGTVQSSWSTA